MRTPENSDFDTLRDPTSTNIEVIVWCKFDRCWKWLGQAVHRNQCFFRSVFPCYFSSSALVLLVSMDELKHIYASELQLSSRFPFHGQDRFLFRFKWGSENEVENSVEKVLPKGPQMDTKSRPKSRERVFWRASKEGPKKGTLSRTGESEILLLFITL